MTKRQCHIYVHDTLAGLLVQDETGIHFQYDPQWVENGNPPISESLPLDNSFSDATAVNFFVNLLPEGARINRIFSMTRIRFGDLTDWLSAYGDDLPGAISVSAAGAGKKGADITERIEKLIDRGYSLDALRERLSLAGIESKTGVIARFGKSGWKFHSPTPDSPSTHILKQAFEISILEAMSMRVLGHAGINVCKTQLIAIAGKPVLLVARYDRERKNHVWKKIPQEDFCQILGRPAEDKYWIDEERGIGNKDFLTVLNRLPASDKNEFLRLSCASLIIGNTDDHAKNYSILHYRDGDRLAPAYDIISVAAARKYVESCKTVSTRLARPFGGETNPSKIAPDHILKHADLFGVPRTDYACLWKKVAAKLEMAIDPAIDSVIDECRQQKFSNVVFREIENFGMLLKRFLKQRTGRFLHLAKRAVEKADCEKTVMWTPDGNKDRTEESGLPNPG